MKKGNLRSSALLLLTACIWGVAFVAQSVGMEYVGPFTFNFVRSILGGLVLIPCIFFLKREKKAKAEKVSEEEKKSTAKNTAGRRDLLWCRPVPGKQFPADRHPIYNRRKSRFHYSVLYCDRSGDRTFYEEEMQSDDLAVGASGSCGFVSALHKRTVFNWIRRYSGICLCDSVFSTYPDRGLFFAEGGRCEDVLHPVSGVRSVIRHCDALCGTAAVIRSASGVETDRLCRYHVLRCRLYPSDRRSERDGSDHCIADPQPRVLYFCAGWLAAAWPDLKYTGRTWLCCHVCGDHSGSASGEGVLSAFLRYSRGVHPISDLKILEK